MAKRLRNPAFKGSDATINTKWHYLRNHCFSEKTSTLNLHSTLASLCKCHACFIYKYMYWMYSIYESVGVRWSWHVVVINKWKALPCVSGGESQSLGSSLQHNSPEKHTVYTEYIYTLTHIKRLFLPDLVQSGGALFQYQSWDRCYIVQFDIPTVTWGSPQWNNNT